MRRIASTARDLLRPRGVHGQQVLDLHQQLARMIEARTGDAEAAHLLAEPMVNRARDQIDWYSRVEGAVRPSLQLSAAQRQATLNRANEMVAQIRAIAEELRATGQPQRIADADLLAAAVVDPRPDELYLVGTQPVIVNWGCDLVVGERPAPPPVEPPRRVQPIDPAKAETPLQPDPPATRHDEPPVVPPRTRLRPLMMWGAAVMLLLAAEPFAFSLVLSPPVGEAKAVGDRQRALQVEVGDLLAGIDRKRWDCKTAADQAPVGISVEDIKSRLARDNVDLTGITMVLAWRGRDDLDLSVKTPSGDVIAAGRPPARDGGRHVMAWNQAGRTTDRPVEVVQWSGGRAAGAYAPIVNRRRFDASEGPPRNLTGYIIVMRDGEKLDGKFFYLSKDIPEFVLNPMTVPAR